MSKESFVMISVKKETREILTQLKNGNSYNELIESLINIITAFNTAFKQVTDKTLLMILYQQLQVDLDKKELELIEKVIA